MIVGMVLVRAGSDTNPQIANKSSESLPDQAATQMSQLTLINSSFE